MLDELGPGVQVLPPVVAVHLSPLVLVTGFPVRDSDLVSRNRAAIEVLLHVLVEFEEERDTRWKFARIDVTRVFGVELHHDLVGRDREGRELARVHSSQGGRRFVLEARVVVVQVRLDEGDVFLRAVDDLERVNVVRCHLVRRWPLGLFRFDQE